jgi:transcriptional regulator with XRE-family HTH domain
MPPKTKESIAERIRAAREQAQMEPAALRHALKAKGFELSKTGLHRLETVEPTNPNLRLVQAIAEITNVTPSWLLFGQGAAIPAKELGSAIRGRVLDTIELVSRALDLTAKQQRVLDDWLESVRSTVPAKITRP